MQYNVLTQFVIGMNVTIKYVLLYLRYVIYCINTIYTYIYMYNN